MFKKKKTIHFTIIIVNVDSTLDTTCCSSGSLTQRERAFPYRTRLSALDPSYVLSFVPSHSSPLIKPHPLNRRLLSGESTSNETQTNRGQLFTRLHVQLYGSLYAQLLNVSVSNFK